MTPGQMDYTSRPLDVALQQDGWLAVQTADGSEGYTRNGAIQVSPTGELTIQGHPVIGEAGPIAVPEGSEVTIAAGWHDFGTEPWRSGQYGRASWSAETGEGFGK
ncbi:flagellar basal body rod protein FlgF [Citrobacter freundii]|nr:flagellar basal body rod protein FlgF [Citrobacter freundii]